MFRVSVGIAVLATVCTFGAPLAYGQSSAERPSFEIADVHVSPRADWVKIQRLAMQGGYLAGDRYEVRRATMLDLIATAYGIERDKVYGGPSWLDYDRFEIRAKTAAKAPPEKLRGMLQSLLADRFGLVVKPDTRATAGYILTRTKGDLKLKQSQGGNAQVGCRATSSFSLGGNREPEHNVICQSAGIESLTQALTRALSRPGTNIAVLDSTGLTGTWDLELKYTDTPGVPTDRQLIEALAKLGLTLQQGEVPQAVLTVERVNEKAGPNPPGVETALPARPLPQFEVATVRLAGQSGGSRALQFQGGGRVTASGMPPGILIQQAWNLPSYEAIVGLPKSFGGSTAKNISIVAKAPDGWFPEAPAAANSQAREILYAMLQALLIDRYKMEVHWEDRPMDALSITTGKPKLTKADPGNRTGCLRENQQQQGRSLLVKLVCRNITMAQFAEQMPAFDTTIWYPATDATGLDAAWDFTLNYDALANLSAPVFAAGRGAATSDATDPSGSVSFVDAVQKQLGLKIEKQKRPEKVLVIDHMLEDPIEN